MSMFLNPYASQELSQEKLDIASVQFEAMNTSFNAMLRACLEKCIPHEYGEAELNKGESTCIDRCVAKAHFTNRLVGGFVHARGVGPDRLRHYERFQSDRTQ
ncbi:LAMI_0E09494g1_1 [Lachancea mirantina]|uniref:Mitochondrial import inner membrane translocase subunit n=1 Tax=Lachancea mirantina TaxID=1230905 RepID=A0A1G4JNJ2_9SACH|nr:LAMI_0E09494g1_1 [Lachancea mirantina]